MLDVGAHDGVFALVVAHELRARGWPGQVHSFEPDPVNHQLLAHNEPATVWPRPWSCTRTPC
jgi:FkbM family methyltransferase